MNALTLKFLNFTFLINVKLLSHNCYTTARSHITHFTPNLLAPLMLILVLNIIKIKYYKYMTINFNIIYYICKRKQNYFFSHCKIYYIQINYRNK